jgi:RNA polymerase sigma-70 factor (ECF subfamily)
MRKLRKKSDRQILLSLEQQGSQGWELFCREFDPLIRAIVNWSLWHFTKDAKQDVLQNVHVSLQAALLRFRGDCTLSWYVKRIALNCCIDEIRRQVYQRKLSTSSTLENPDGESGEMEFECSSTLSPHRVVSRNEQYRALHDALEQLHETCRESIKLFYLHELTYREISDRLGIAVNTVGSRLAKCLPKLKQHLHNNPLFERTHS